MLLQGCVLRVGVLGINFKTAELQMREAIAKCAARIAGEKALFFPHSTVLLSTCNRTEVYFSADDLAQAQSDVIALLRPHIEEPFEHRLYSYFGADCFAHLCRVAAGLDSAIVAETEIQRQVKAAYAKASETFPLPSCLHYLFQKALKVAKSVRNQIGSESGAPTLFGTLWRLALQHFGSLEGKKILLVGYSEIHRGLASFLEHKGVKNWTYCTRSPHLVAGSRAIGRDGLSSWSDFDLISCASQSDGFLVQGRGKKRHLIFDLSVPRNVDPEVESTGASLYNIEQIDRMIEQKQGMQDDAFRCWDSYIWESVLLLTRLYRAKLDRASRIIHV